MASLRVWWWSLVCVGLWQAVQGAHIPPNTSSEDEVQTAFDTGETENNPLDILQDIMDMSKKDESPNDIKTRLEKELNEIIPERSEAPGKEDMQVRGKTTTTTTLTTTTTRPPPTTKTTGGRGKTEPAPNRPSLYAYTKQELITLFHEGRRGNGSVMTGCPVPQLSVKTRCFANVMELTVTSRMNLLGHLIMEGGDGIAEIKGAYLVAFAVVATAGQRGRLTTSLLKTDVNINCDYCDHLVTQLYLKIGEVKCFLVGECTPSLSVAESLPNLPDRAYFSPTTTNTPTTTHDPTTTAKTTMSLLEGSSGLDGLDVSSAVPLGTKLSLVVSVYSRDLPLDLHLIKCEARDEEGRAVVLLKDGCSVSQVLEDFREVLEAAGDTGMRRVSQYAKLRVFNTRAAPQNITLLCTIKVCSGECPERPNCVHSDINLGRSKRPFASLYSRQVTLAKVFRVAGFPVNRPIAQQVPPSKSPGDQTECDCSHVAGVQGLGATGGYMSHQTVYLLLALSSGFYILLMLCIYYFLRRSPAPYTPKKAYEEDAESPLRALYSEYSSPRRRTPPSSSNYSVNMTQTRSSSPYTNQSPYTNTRQSPHYN